MDTSLRSTSSYGSSSSSLYPSLAGESRIPMPARPSSLPFSKLQSSATGTSTSSQLSFTSFRSETDLTTPSLCSDTEQDGDRSLDDRPPATPPMATMSRTNSRDVSRERTAPPNMAGATSRSAGYSDRHVRKAGSEGVRIKSTLVDDGDGSGVFSRRPPSSPMLLDSPRRPRPPASKKSKTSATRRGGEDPVPQLSYSLKATSSNQTVSRKQARAPRMVSSSPTLDQELQRALEAEIELETDTYSGVGTRSMEEGFLAHGGAGGIPVLIGPGNLAGLEDREAEYQYQTRRRSSKSTSRQTRV